MKTSAGSTFLAGLALFTLVATAVHAGDLEERKLREKQIEAAYETVFFSVLDGCFRDGLSNADVDQILLRAAPGASYEHFIYACPICMATARALEAYRAGPDFSERKLGGKVTFGQGLTPDMHARLYSADPKARLSVIHDLEEHWVSRHLDALRLNASERAQAQAELKVARDEGLKVMQSFDRQGNLQKLAPAYRAGDECALCNGAAGMTLKLSAEPAR